MKRGLLMFVFGAVVLASAAPIAAETKIEVTGQVRLREEFDKRSFDTSATTLTFGDLRTRVMVDAVVDENTHAVVQFQDSRRLGSTNQFGKDQSGTLNDSKNVDLHQAYIQVDRLWGDGWGMKAGRFELNMGNQRVFGAVGWSNVGRAWEGGMGWYDHEQFKVTGFGLKRKEVNDATLNRDFDIFGGDLMIKKYYVDLFFFYEYDPDTVGLTRGQNKLDRGNAGLYYQRKYDASFDVELNGVFQFGQQASSGQTLEDDIEAFMFTAEFGYTFESSGNPRVAIGIDYSSGDDDLADTSLAGDTTFETYQNLYYTGHKFRGWTDYFVGSKTAGLVDLMLRGKVSPFEGWTVNSDIHLFQTAEDYLSPINGATTTDVGWEFDLAIKTTKVQGVTFKGGVSLFLPEDDFAGFVDPDPGFWAYTMTTVNF
ncbi:MAG: alginate export family protein [Candidatus Zixiibacteriota bacterium]